MTSYYPWFRSRTVTVLIPLVWLFGATLVGALLGVPLHGWWSDAPGALPKTVRWLSLIGLLSAVIAAARSRWGTDWLRLAGTGVSSRAAMFEGLSVGVLMLASLIAVLIGLHIRVLDSARLIALPALVALAGKALLTAIVVAVLEEYLFRAILLGWLARRLALITAIPISAAYYAALHFVGWKIAMTADMTGWSAGLQLLPYAYAAVFSGSHGPALASLFVAGVLLGLIRATRPAGLAYCIGMHLGWVWVIKATHGVSRVDEHSPLVAWIDRYDGVTGWLAVLWLLGFTGFWISRLPAAAYARLHTVNHV